MTFHFKYYLNFVKIYVRLDGSLVKFKWCDCEPWVGGKGVTCYYMVNPVGVPAGDRVKPLLTVIRIYVQRAHGAWFEGLIVILEFTMGDKDGTTENAPANAGDETEGFDLVDWCKTHKITRKTEALLRKEALDSPEALALLTTQDLYELGLPLGQRKLMQVALSIWQPGTSKNDASGDASDRPPSDRALGDVQGADGGQGQTISIDGIRRQADALGAAGKAFDTALFDGLSKVNVTDKPAAPKHLLPAPTHSSDPRTILTIKASAGKAVHINTFLTEKTKKRINARKRGVVLGTTEDDNIVLRTDDRHPYTGITHSEWSAANCRLMAFLLRSGELALSDVEYYLAYTTMIHQYYEVYEWDSILEFDYLYRERICEHGFQWGFIPANMELGLLANPRRPRQGNTANGGQGFRAAAGAQPRRQAGPPKTKAPGEECRLYKNFNGNCPYGDACIFVHPALPKTSPQ